MYNQPRSSIPELVGSRHCKRRGRKEEGSKKVEENCHRESSTGIAIATLPRTTVTQATQGAPRCCSKIQSRPPIRASQPPRSEAVKALSSFCFSVLWVCPPCSPSLSLSLFVSVVSVYSTSLSLCFRSSLPLPAWMVGFHFKHFSCRIKPSAAVRG